VKGEIGTWSGGEKNNVWPEASLERIEKNNPPFRAEWTDGKEYEFLELKNMIIRQPLKRRANGYFITVPGTTVEGRFFEVGKDGEELTRTTPAGQFPMAEEIAKTIGTISETTGEGYTSAYLVSPQWSSRRTLLSTLEEAGIDEKDINAARNFGGLTESEKDFLDSRGLLYKYAEQGISNSLGKDCGVEKKIQETFFETVKNSSLSVDVEGECTSGSSVPFAFSFIDKILVDEAKKIIDKDTAFANKILEWRMRETCIPNFMRQSSSEDISL